MSMRCGHRVWLSLAAIAICLPAVSAVLGGCYNEPKQWDAAGEELPEWAYDAPYYYQPSAAADPQATDVGLDGRILHYYLRDPVVLIKRPDVSDGSITPRLGIYWSNDRGRSWHKAGYFGVNQPFFSFAAPGEGDYGVRFFGPGIEPSRVDPNVPPQRIYHVDLTPPAITVQVQPTKDFYRVGEDLTVSWSVSDAWISPDAKVTIYSVTYPATVRVLGDHFPLSGSIAVSVSEMARDGGMQFAVEAADKSGNIGRGFSFWVRTPTSPPSLPQTSPAILHPAEPPAAQQPADEPAKSELPTPMVPPTTEPTPSQPATPAVPPTSVVRPPQAPVEDNSGNSAVYPPPADAQPPTTQPDDEERIRNATRVDRALEPGGYRPPLVPGNSETAPAPK
ncbi:MAG: hypothetical protein BIFFINMI_02520 [Phycisphaerae bacterium]|nr:hypothetical protein [Phycisphaerae bacterium]